MTTQLALDLAPGRARRDDHATSREGAADVALRAGSQKLALLLAYLDVDLLGEVVGLTDEEAARAAALPPRSCYWKRCGELRALGLIEPTGETRIGEAGVARIVCELTDAGHRRAASVRR